MCELFFVFWSRRFKCTYVERSMMLREENQDCFYLKIFPKCVCVFLREKHWSESCLLQLPFPPHPMEPKTHRGIKLATFQCKGRPPNNWTTLAREPKCLWFFKIVWQIIFLISSRWPFFASKHFFTMFRMLCIIPSTAVLIAFFF